LAAPFESPLASELVPAGTALSKRALDTGVPPLALEFHGDEPLEAIRAWHQITPFNGSHPAGYFERLRAAA